MFQPCRARMKNDLPAFISFHFLGNPDRPIIYHVDRTRDGRSFSTRYVKAVQKNSAILSLQVI